MVWTSSLACFTTNPRGSMYSIFTYIWVIFMVNVGRYTIHGSYGNQLINLLYCFTDFLHMVLFFCNLTQETNLTQDDVVLWKGEGPGFDIVQIASVWYIPLRIHVCPEGFSPAIMGMGGVWILRVWYMYVLNMYMLHGFECLEEYYVRMAFKIDVIDRILIDTLSRHIML